MSFDAGFTVLPPVGELSHGVTPGHELSSLAEDEAFLLEGPQNDSFRESSWNMDSSLFNQDVSVEASLESEAQSFLEFEKACGVLKSPRVSDTHYIYDEIAGHVEAAAISVLASEREEFIDEAFIMFDTLDSDGNGVIDGEELKQLRSFVWEKFHPLGMFQVFVFGQHFKCDCFLLGGYLLL